MTKFKRKIDFYDCDPAGILFFARIYNLCHSAYEELVSSFGLKEDYWNNESYIVPIINSEAFYHKPYKYNDIAVIEVAVSQLKSSSFELSYLCKNQDGEKCVKVRTAHVFVDKKTWKKMEMPAKIKNSLDAHKNN